MRVQTFKNGKGLIHGKDPKRIGCDREGILDIGGVKAHIAAEAESVLPLLFNGCTGLYQATFADNDGNVFELGKVEVRGGRIVPPSDTAVELMELRCRLDEMEDECVRLQKQIDFLSGIFDTNSLNFLIK
jgi:hypothetical protein